MGLAPQGVQQPTQDQPRWAPEHAGPMQPRDYLASAVQRIAAVVSAATGAAHAGVAVEADYFYNQIQRVHPGIVLIAQQL